MTLELDDMLRFFIRCRFLRAAMPCFMLSTVASSRTPLMFYARSDMPFSRLFSYCFDYAMLQRCCCLLTYAMPREARLIDDVCLLQLYLFFAAHDADYAYARCHAITPFYAAIINMTPCHFEFMLLMSAPLFCLITAPLCVVAGVTMLSPRLFYYFMLYAALMRVADMPFLRCCQHYMLSLLIMRAIKTTRYVTATASICCCCR